MSELQGSLAAAVSGLRAQSTRLRVSAENIANANSTGATPEADPYRRRVPVFEEALLRSLDQPGVHGVRVTGAEPDPSPFGQRLEPGHPAADANGYVKTPNVDTLVELTDMREATRAYEANLNMLETARRMGERALDVLRRR
jgi:flagellar basal-body rod protein FlgC